MTTMTVTDDSITDDIITDDTAIDLDDRDDESHIVRGLD